MKKLVVFLILTAFAGAQTIPAARSASWIAGVDVGIPGGMERFLAGSGHSDERPSSGPKFINVTLPPYNVAPNDNTTTGTVANGSTELVVADATGFEVGNNIQITGAGSFTVLQSSISVGPTSSGDITVTLEGSTPQVIALTAGQTASEAAAVIRGTTFPNYTTGGSGNIVTYTAQSPGWRTNPGLSAGTTGLVSTQTRAFTGATPYSTSIAAKYGNTLTLALAPDAGVTGGAVRHDAAIGINAALAAVAEDGVVYMPAGNYSILSAIGAGYKDRYTLRGAGETTIIKPYGSTFTPMTLGGSADYTFSVPNLMLSEGLTQGQTVIPVADTSLFTAGNLIQLSVLNSTDPDLPVVNVSGTERSRLMMSRVVSVQAGVSITIFPGLYYDMPLSLAPRLSRATNVAEYVGWENFRLDMTNSDAPFAARLMQTYACWVYGVMVNDTTNRLLDIAWSVNPEVRECQLLRRRGTGSNGAGLLFGQTSAALVEDNIIVGIASSVQINAGASGNVFGYNLFYDSRLNGAFGPSLKTNHSPHNSFNLFEGNSAPNIQSDGYFGGSSEDSVFRNWFHATNPGGLTGEPAVLNRFSRRYTFVANVLGTPSVFDGKFSYGNPYLASGSFTGTAMPSGWLSTLSVRSSATAGTATASTYPEWQRPTASTSHTIATGQVVDVWWTGGERFDVVVGTVSGDSIPFSGGTGNDLPAASTTIYIRDWWADFGGSPGVLGFAEYDLDVQQSTITKDNYLVSGAGGSIGDASGETHAASLYRTTKPAFIGNLPWPAYDSSDPVFDLERIPAGYRYFNEGSRAYLTDPPPDTEPGEATATVTTLNATTLNIAP